MKKTIYFSHDADAREDTKCINLIEELGMEGYGIFWMLIEVLRQQPDFTYPIPLISSLARKYNTKKETISKVIKDYDLFVFDDEIFYSKRLCDSMDLMVEISIKRSEAGKISAQKRYNQ
jgi:hypothetical protein